MLRAGPRPMRHQDLRAAAELHARALPAGFFAQLGERFLAAYLGSFVTSPHAVALVTQDGGGFLVGTVQTPAHYRWVVRHHGIRLALRGLLALVARPALLWRFVTTRLARYGRSVWRLLGGGRRTSSEVDDAREDTHVVAVLTHVAVAEHARGRGVGAALTDAFVASCRREGVDEVRLVTNAEGGAAGFYRQLGWRELRTRQAADGRPVVEFGLALRTPGQP